MKRWAQVNALYQIYPRSFYDTNADGVGDLAGITEKLPYLKGGSDSLGIDAIWLSPFYTSPMADFGYDISDYRDVDPMFGSLADFDKLVAAAKELDIKVMIDFVPNHTSNKHAWFEESRSSRTNDKRDYYVWRDPKPDGSPPSNWLSVFGGSAWEFDETTGQYYLHSFLKEQPDLNWDNPAVRDEMKNVLRFWLERGVDGFRVDVARYVSKHPTSLDDPLNPYFDESNPFANPYGRLQHFNSKYGPNLFSYWGEMAEVVAEYDDAILIFEDYTDNLRDIESQRRNFYSVWPGLTMPFNFGVVDEGWSAKLYGDFINTSHSYLGEHDRPVYCFSNHDKPRIVSRFGEAQARLVAMMQLTLPGLPIVYYGDEVGAFNGSIAPDQIQDPFEIANPNRGLGRDPYRTPMKWSPGMQGGFTGGSPWLPVADKGRSQAEQRTDPDSFFALYRLLLKLRKDHPVLIDGAYRQLYIQDDVLCYERVNEAERFVVVLNFSDGDRQIDIATNDTIVCHTHPHRLSHFDAQIRSVTLRGYEGVVIQTAQ